MGRDGFGLFKKEVYKMKKMRNVEWGKFRHPEFLESLTISVNEFKFIRLFLKRGSIAMVNELLWERNMKQKSRPKDYFPPRFNKREKIVA